MPRVKSVSSKTPKYPVVCGTSSGRVSRTSVWTGEFLHCSQDESGPNVKACDPLAEKEALTLRFSPFYQLSHLPVFGATPSPGWAVLAQEWGLRPQYDHPEQRRRAAKGWSRRGGRAILVHRLFVISSESTVGRELLEGPADTIREVGLSLEVPLRAHEEELAAEVPGMSIPHVAATTRIQIRSSLLLRPTRTGGADRVRRSSSSRWGLGADRLPCRTSDPAGL